MDLWSLADLDAPPQQPRVVHSDEGAARVVAIRLDAGEELQEHQVHEHAWLHVASGTVEIDADGTQQQVQVGALVHWAPGERHAVRAIDGALLTLILAPWPGRGHPGSRPR